MRLVIDTSEWNPILKRAIVLFLLVLAICVAFEFIESFLGYTLQWWKGYSLGFVGGMAAFKPL